MPPRAPRDSPRPDRGTGNEHPPPGQPRDGLLACSFHSKPPFPNRLGSQDLLAEIAQGAEAGPVGMLHFTGAGLAFAPK